MKFPHDMNESLNKEFNYDANKMMDLLCEGCEVLRVPNDDKLTLLEILNGNKAIFMQFKQVVNSLEMVHNAALHVYKKREEEKDGEQQPQCADS